MRAELGIPVFYENEAVGTKQKEPLKLGDDSAWSSEQWAMLAAQPENWEQAAGQLQRGVLSSWLDKIDVDTDLINYLQEKRRLRTRRR